MSLGCVSIVRLVLELLCCCKLNNILQCAFCHMKGLGGAHADKQRTVRTVLARLSLFSSAHYKEHIVSSFKLPGTKLLFSCLRVSMCRSATKYKCAKQSSNTHTHRCCNSNTEILRLLNLQQSIGYHRKGKKTHEILNTRQTYQPLTAEYGLGHLP